MAKPSRPSSSAPGKKSSRHSATVSKSSSTSPSVLIFWGILGAIAVVGLIVLLTPSIEEEPITVGSGTTDIAEVGDAAPSIPKVSLPTVGEEVETERLQSELADLAKLIPQRYPKDVAAFHFAAQIYAQLKQTQLAEQAWKKSLDLGPRFSGPAVGLATVWLESGRDEEALELLLHAQQNLVPSPELFLKLGEVHVNLGELDEAIAIYQQCLQQYPGLNAARLALGQAQNQNGQFAEAEANLKKLIEVEGVSEPLLFALIVSVVRQGKAEEAAELREQLVKLQQAKDSEDSSFQGQYDEALRGIAADMYVAAAAIEEEHGQLEQAEKYCLRALALSPQHLQAYMSLAGIYRSLGRLPDALAVQVRLLEVQPNNMFNYLNLSSVALQLGDVRLAEETLKKATERDPQGTLAQTGLARLYYATGQFERALPLALQVVSREETVDTLSFLASCYQATGDTVNAQATSQQAKALANATGRQ